MEISKKILKCDQCEKTLEYEDVSYYGGHPTGGWMHLTIHGGSTTIESLRAQKEFDFCSRKCVHDWSIDHLHAGMKVGDILIDGDGLEWDVDMTYKNHVTLEGRHIQNREKITIPKSIAKLMRKK